MTDDFDLGLRRFLKEVGVTSQREIGRALREARAAGTLGERVRLRAVVSIDGLGLRHEVEADLATAGLPE